MPETQITQSVPAWVGIVAFFAGPFAERIVRLVMGMRKAGADEAVAERAYWDEKTQGFIEKLEDRLEALEDEAESCRTKNEALTRQIARLEGVLIANGIDMPELSGEIEVGNA